VIHFPPDFSTSATYVALLAAVLSLWLTRTAWIAVLVVAVIAGYLCEVLEDLAALWIGLLAALCVDYRRTRNAPRTGLRQVTFVISVFGIIAVTVLLGMHALPGFNNYRAAQDVVLTPGAAPYSLYLNFDKTAAGLLLLGIVYQNLLRSGKDWRLALQRAVPLIAANVVVLILLALPLGYLTFDPKWPPLFWIWAPVNLFFTCVTEEAFFRGFIQRELASALPKFPWLAVGVSAVLFGLAHFAGGWMYVLLATVAGAGYALIFHRTQRVEMSILAHFALNATHFLLFTYPHSA
jgi:membrane protease YdiL (CAAX protease family)